MTTEIKELAADLNDLQILPPMECIEDYNNAHGRKLYGRAADALEAMAGEVERLTVAAKAADMFHAINGHGIKQAEELADHIIRQMLWGMRIDDSNKGIVRGYLLDHFKAVISRAEAAEAERDRLKAALDIAKAHAKQNQRARDLVSPYPNDHAKRIVWEKALYHEGKDLWDKLRKALGGDAS